MTTTAAPEQTSCIRWNRRRHSEAPIYTVNPSMYSVELIPRDMAREFIEMHHYSGTFPAARLCVGLFRAGRLIRGMSELVGVSVASVGQQKAAGPCYAPGTAPEDTVELGRFVLLDDEPANTETFKLKRFMKLLRLHKPDVKFLLSYSDPFERRNAAGEVVKVGHFGIIYQAHNARYFGQGKARNKEMTRTGKIVCARTIAKIPKQHKGWRSALAELERDTGLSLRVGESLEAFVERALATLTVIRHPGNHAYGWALERGLQLKAAKPYPKPPKTEVIR